MKKFVILSGMVLFSGCALNENQVREAVKKDPRIVFEVIEENPEQFIEVVNRAAQKAQEAQYKKRFEEIQAKQEADFKNPKKPELAAERRLIGEDQGKIVIVEYADFQCPACQMAYKSLNEFKEKYKDQVQFYYKHMPLSFHKMAYPAALYFEALLLQDKNKAAKFYKMAFENQKALSEDFLEKTAKKTGANMSRLKQDLASAQVKERVEKDMKEFEGFGFTGTPVVLINGVALEGAQGMEALERVAQRTLK